MINDIVTSIHQGILASFPSDERKAWEVVAKAGHTKRSARKGQTVPHEVPETMLWHVAFDFAQKMEAKAAEAISQGNDGGLFRNYFTRQGPLSVESDAALKEMAAKYFEEIAPIEQRAKTIIESARASSSDFSSQSSELNELKSQKEAAALRNRDLLKGSIGEEKFTEFLKFLKGEFSEGAVSGMLKPSKEAAKFSPQGIFFEGWSWIVWNDSVQPPLITGFSELYLYYFDPIAPYDPSLDSFFVNLTSQSLLSSARFIDGYRDWFPAQYFHPVFFSTRGNEYCTLTDFYMVLYDGPVLIDEVPLGSNGVCHVVGPAPPTPSPTPTPNVVSVTLSQVHPSTVDTNVGITPNPTVLPHNPGIGERIFPDKEFPNEDPNVIDRRLVRVTATLSQPIANVPVYFRNFDLDDPATDTTIDINGTAGNDNNGTPRAGQLLFANGCGANGPSVFCPTDANGVATIEFSVTRQPGDNFAVAASISPIAVNGVTINGIELNDSGGQPVPTQNCPTQQICRSQMLTVWRRLHIEVDSMGQSAGNFVVGNSATFARIRSSGTAVLDVNTTEPLEVNRFENGRVVVSGRQLGVISNTADSITVTNSLPPGTQIIVSVGAQFQLYDDDDFDDNNGNVLIGDTGEDILGPDQNLPSGVPLRGLELLTANSDDLNSNVFSAAYVRPIYDISDPRDNCNFQANTDSSATGDLRPLRTLCWDSNGTNTDVEFWSVLIYGSYQHTADEDSDPGTDGLTWGIVDSITLFPDPGDPTDDGEGSSAFVFIELHRPTETPGYTSAPTNLNSMAVTVAHEVSHLFSCRHGEGGLMGTDPVFGTPVSNQLSPTMIRNVRVLAHP